MNNNNRQTYNNTTYSSGTLYLDGLSQRWRGGWCGWEVMTEWWRRTSRITCCHHTLRPWRRKAFTRDEGQIKSSQQYHPPASKFADGWCVVPIAKWRTDLNQRQRNCNNAYDTAVNIYTQMLYAFCFLLLNNSAEVSVYVGAVVPVQPGSQPLSTQSLLAVKVYHIKKNQEVMITR